MNYEQVFTLVEAIHRAHFDAIHKLAFDARFIDDVRHTDLRNLFSGLSPALFILTANAASLMDLITALAKLVFFMTPTNYFYQAPSSPELSASRRARTRDLATPLSRSST